MAEPSPESDLAVVSCYLHVVDASEQTTAWISLLPSIGAGWRLSSFNAKQCCCV
jgi:hypothetical protein